MNEKSLIVNDNGPRNAGFRIRFYAPDEAFELPTLGNKRFENRGPENNDYPNTAHIRDFED